MIEPVVIPWLAISVMSLAPVIVKPLVLIEPLADCSVTGVLNVTLSLRVISPLPSALPIMEEAKPLNRSSAVAFRKVQIINSCIRDTSHQAHPMRNGKGTQRATAIAKKALARWQRSIVVRFRMIGSERTK
jgi:hypothetical protein